MTTKERVLTVHVERILEFTEYATITLLSAWCWVVLGIRIKREED